MKQNKYRDSIFQVFSQREEKKEPNNDLVSLNLSYDVMAAKQSLVNGGTA
jgi:hypothetical protein